MPITAPFRFGVDNAKRLLHLTAIGEDGNETRVSLTLDDISKLMAALSHSQHALALAHAGRPIDPRGFDPNSAFDTIAGAYAIGSFETLSRLSVGMDDTRGEVTFACLGSSGRLSGYHMPPDKAQQLGDGLLKIAGEILSQPPSRPQ